MAVIAGVISKGPFQKVPSIEDVLVDDMSCGVLEDGQRLCENKTGKYTILYFKKNIQRGFEVLLERGAVYIKLQLPASEEEIKAFFAYIRFLCEKMGTESFICYDREFTCESIDELIKFTIDNSVQTLWDIRKKIDNDECVSLYINGAKNPISLGKDEMKEINGDLESLGKLLHRIQSIDAYYAVPAIYKLEDGRTLGLYTVSENTDSIFPERPGDGMFLREKPDVWKVILSLEGEQAGIIGFDELMANAQVIKRYDARRVVIRLSSDEIKALAEKYGTGI